MHGGVEAQRVHGHSSAIEARGSSVFVLLVGDDSVRLLRVDGEAVDDVRTPAELADPPDPPRLGPGGALHTATVGWAPGESPYAVPEGSFLRDAMVADSRAGETYFLRQGPEGDVQVVNHSGVPRERTALDPALRHAFAPPIRGELRVASGEGEWTLLAGRGGSPSLGMLMRSNHLPSAVRHRWRSWALGL